MQPTLRTTDIKTSNKLNVLQYLRLHKEITKPDIAKQLGYSAPTVSKLVDELVEEGFAKINGRGMSTEQGGKRPKLYAFNAMGGAIVAVHLRSKMIEAALVNLEAQVLYRLSETIRAKEDQGKTVGKVEQLIGQLLRKAEEDGLKVLAAGIGCPGLVDFHAGTIRSSHGLNVLEGVALSELLRSRFRIPVWVDNECNNLALAEQWFGTGEQNGTAINLMIEEGLGAGIIIQRTLFRGEDNSFGEVGHMVIDRNGRPCYCGNRGCWEMYVSTGILIERAAEARDRSPWLSGRTAGKDGMTIPLIAEAVRQGDPIARAIAVDDLANDLAVGIASIVNLFNPREVVLHGSLQPLAAPLLEAIPRLVAERALPMPASRVRIRFSAIERDPHLVGAATLGLKELFDSPEELFALRTGS